MRVLIVGGGKVGAHLAGLLTAWNHKVRLIEVRSEAVAQLRLSLPDETVILGSGTDPAALESAGAREADVVAAVTGADETNIVVATLARFEYAVPRVIVRVNNPKNIWLCTPEMGVDVALCQADLMAHLIAEEMSLGDMTTLLKLRMGQYSLVEEKVHPSAAAVGTSIRDLALPHECVVTAVIRQGQLIIPRGDTVLLASDEVLAVVHSSQAQDLAELLGAP